MTPREYLTLMEAKDLAARRIEEFYYLSRSALVKDVHHDPRASSRHNAIDRFSHLTGDQVLRLVPSR